MIDTKLRRHKQKLSEARKRVSGMDLLTGPDRGISTIVMALTAGLQSGDESAAYDALYMLIDIQAEITNDELHTVNMKNVFMTVDSQMTADKEA